MLHRIHEAWASQRDDLFSGPVEADETYKGGRRKNMPKSKRQNLKGHGAVGKAAELGTKDRTIKRVSARVVESTDARTLQGFVRERVNKGTFRRIGAKPLQRYVNGFAGHHNVRSANTIRSMESMVIGLLGARLRDRDLIA